MTSHHPDDVPPPPYSETDIYSNSGSGSRHAHRTPPRDDASSTGGEVIYTPPPTPRDADSQPEHQRPRQQRQQQQQQQEEEEAAAAGDADHLTTASAEAYFESRPAPAERQQRQQQQQQQQQLAHTVAVGPGSVPGDLPYRADLLAGRDVRAEDWQTFVNYLIPHHAAESNGAVADRKLRAEAGPGAAPGPSKAGGEPRSPIGAQLDQIRSPGAGGDDDRRRRRGVEETVRDWNDGFFVPRGVVIRLEQPAGTGGWGQSFDGAEGQQQQQQPPPPPSGAGSRFGLFSPFGGGRGRGRGWGLGGISVGEHGVAIGGNVVADRNGVRIGRFVANHDGVRFGGADAGPPPPGAPPQAGCGIDEPHRHDPDGRCMGTRRDRGGGGGRWWKGGGERRGRQHRHGGGEKRRVRSRSASSTSSSSSESSSESSSSESEVSSVGSLPDWDGLKDSQLPVAQRRLRRWLDHPDNMITRDSVREAREQIKAAKKDAAAGARGAGQEGDPPGPAALRSQVKSLMAQWKALKKQQRQERRQLKRQRKQQRRADRRDRRQVRREVRRSRREAKREAKREARRERRGPPGPPEAPWATTHGHHPLFGPGHGPPGHHLGPGQPLPRGFAESMQDFGERMGAWGVEMGRSGAEFGERAGAEGRALGASFAGGGGPRWGGGAGRGGRGGWWSPWGGQQEPQQEHHAAAAAAAAAAASPWSRSPGAWPSDEEAGRQGAAAAHGGSRARYRAVEGLQQELDEKKVELKRLREEQRGGEGPQAGAGAGAADPGGEAADGPARGLELEVASLQETVGKLTLEADEEYAKELAGEESGRRTA